MCDNSRMGNLDLVKNSFAAEPEKQKQNKSTKSTFRHARLGQVCARLPSLTGYEAVEVGLDGLELVDVVLPLLVRDPPGVVVGAGLTLDLIGRCCRGHRPHRCAFLQTSRKEWSQRR